MMIGLSKPSPRRVLHTSRPESLGSMMSSTTRSGLAERARSRADTPSEAVSTSYPSNSKLSLSPSTMSGSSSTTRILANLLPVSISGGALTHDPDGSSRPPLKPPRSSPRCARHRALRAILPTLPGAASLSGRCRGHSSLALHGQDQGEGAALAGGALHLHRPAV